VQHSQEAFDELCKQYPKSTHMCLATMTFDANNNPVKLYLGIHGAENTKNSYYCEIDMSVATLPELQHLVPMVNEAYTSLYIRRIDKGGSFLFCTSTSYGSRPIGRNQSEKWIKEVTGHAAGVLRQSIQNHAFDLYIADPIKFDLKALTLCTGRCQHRAETACQKYMTESITKKKERLAQAQVADAVEAIVDQVENEETSEESTEDNGAPVTVADFEHMLTARKDELKYTDTGRGWEIVQPVKPMPIDEVMSILRSKYDDSATLTPEMINDIDWYECDTGDFRSSAIPDDNIPDQLNAVLNGTALPDATRAMGNTGPSPGSEHVIHLCRRDTSSEEDTDDSDTETEEESDDIRGTSPDSDQDTESNSEFEDESDGDEGPGPAVRALIAAFTAAYESDRKRRRR
jgi:hypothetical protein